MRWAGSGSELWFVRVEIFVDDDSARLVGPTWDALSRLLVHGEPADRGGHGTDQGTGMATPVVGMVFSVAADSPGQASQTAVEVATNALGPDGRGLYGVSVIPHSKAPANREPDFPSLND
jgi:hypothetical protein